jgi:hypothetical protein
MKFLLIAISLSMTASVYADDSGLVGKKLTLLEAQNITEDMVVINRDYKDNTCVLALFDSVHRKIPLMVPAGSVIVIDKTYRGATGRGGEHWTTKYTSVTGIDGHIEYGDKYTDQWNNSFYPVSIVLSCKNPSEVTFSKTADKRAVSYKTVLDVFSDIVK